MSATAERSATEWLNRRTYPFAPNYLNVDGGRMHYVEEGSGEPILFLHGSPTWSYMYRAAIRQLSDQGYRCIAPDHIGFGLSEKPAEWSYNPAAHSRNIAQLIEHLGLRDITLVCHEMGGPIGLGYAAEHPDRIKRLVLMNTWMGALDKDAAAQKTAKVAAGPLGKMLYVNTNTAAKSIRSGFVNREQYTDDMHLAYHGPFMNKESRASTLAAAKHLADSRAWYNEIWSSREIFAAKNPLLIWGLKDSTFGESVLNRIWHELPLAEVTTFADAGHFVLEEKPRETIGAIKAYMAAPVKSGGFLS